MLPVIPDSGVDTFSLCSGSYISNAGGTTGFGRLNNFRFPVPVTLTFKSSDSPFCKVVREGTTLKSNFPTAPLNSGVFPAAGNGFTLMILLPAETRLLSWVNRTCPQPFLRPVGTSQSISNDKGSISNLPDFCGYNTVLRNTT